MNILILISLFCSESVCIYRHICMYIYVYIYICNYILYMIIMMILSILIPPKQDFFVVIQATCLSDFVSGNLLDVRPKHSCAVFGEIFLQKAR